MQQPRQSGVFPVGEVGEQRLDGGLLPVGQLQIEPGVADADHAAQNEVDSRQHQRGQDDIDGAARQKDLQ